VQGSGMYQQPSFSTEVKERVELYLDSLFGLRGLFWDELYHFRLLPLSMLFIAYLV
jgi:hypothetical protein